MSAEHRTQRTEPFRVVGIGELLWDMLPGGKQLGGAPTNFAFHAQSLGANSFVASCVGDDPLGREISAKLHELDLSQEHVAVHPSHPTGTVDVKVDDKGVPDFTICQNVAWDFIPCAAALLELAGRADAVCFGTLAQRSPVSRQTIRQVLQATREGCLHIFDINLRQTYYSKAVIEESLDQSDVLKLNDQELPILRRLFDLDRDDRHAIAQLMQRHSLRLAALTCGDAGSRLYAGGSVYEHVGYPTKVVDTVGAGDAFTAALAVGLLRNDDPLKINDAANRLASYVCSQPGATPPLPRNFWHHDKQ
jgi:fructokinase